MSSALAMHFSRPQQPFIHERSAFVIVKHRRAIAGGFIAAVALLLGLFHGGKYSLWNDEGFSIAAAHLHISSLVTFTGERDPHTGIYHLLLHYWMAIDGDGEAWVRSMSAIFAAMSAIALWFTLRRLYSELVAGAAAVLFVINGFFVAFAQEARPYALVLLLTCGAMWFFVAAVQTGARKYWAGWIVVGALSVSAHPFAAVPLIGAHISLFVAPQRPKVRNWIAIALGQLTLCVPLILMLQAQSVPHIDWVPGLSVSSVGGAANLVTGHGGAGMTLLVAILVMVFTVRTFAQVVKQGQAWPDVLVLSWALLLPLVLVAVSPFQHVLVPRYLAPAVPAIMTAAVVTIGSFRLREYQIGTLVLTALFAVVSVNTYFTHGAKDDWRDAAAYIAQNAQPGDAIIVSYDQRNTFQYYFERDGGKPGSTPTPLSPARPWGSRIPVHEPFMSLATSGTVAREVAPYTRVWSLYLDDEPYQTDLQLGLRAVFAQMHSREFDPRVVATLYSNSAN